MSDPQPPARRQIQVGTELHPYGKVVRQLTAGKVCDTFVLQKGDRKFFLKVLLQKQKVRMLRFEHEAFLLQGCGVPGVPTCRLGVQTYFDTPYFMAQFIDGMSLQSILEKRKLREAEVIRVALVISDILASLHLRGIIHRDVKPGNILFSTKTKRLYLGDFGFALSEYLDDEAEDMMRDTGLSLGTKDFLPPEAMREIVTEATADVFSFGASIFYMLTGNTRTVRMHANAEGQDLPDPRKLNPDLSLDWKDFMQGALAKDPRSRFISAGQMHEFLRERFN